MLLLYLNKIETGCVAEAKACDCQHDRLSVRFPLEEIKYLIFSFPRSGNNGA